MSRNKHSLAKANAFLSGYKVKNAVWRRLGRSIAGALIVVLASHIARAQMTLTSTPNPSALGSAITLSTNPGGAHSGSVSFNYYWGTTAGVTPSNLIKSGSGLISTSWTPSAAGTYYLYATVTPYPDGFCSAGTSNIVTQVVKGTSTTVAVTSSLNPSTYGSSVTFTATVSPSAATGTIQFQSGGANLGSPVTLSSGRATYSTSTLAAGTNSITAIYSGDTHYAGSASSALTETVNKASTTVALSSSLNPSASGAP